MNQTANILQRVRYSFPKTLAITASIAAFAFAPWSVMAQVRDYSTSADYKAIWNSEDANGSSLAGGGSGAGQYGQSTGGGYSADKSRWSHVAIEAGGGFTAPESSSVTYGYNLTFGGGWNFNKYLGTLLEFQFNRNKIPGAVLSAVGAPGGNVNTYSFTIEPVFNYLQRGKWGGYVIGGGGFYRKVTNYTSPQPVQFCNYFYGYCGTAYQNTTIGHFSSNQGGLNIGTGITWQPAVLGDRAKLYAEARYVWVDSPGSSPSRPGTGTEKLIPVTFGIRF